ncbi:hypothetical protein E2C11_16640 [Streptomyces lavendulae]|nr:hypothetical protein [Streptomyces lavendulae]TXJ78634.1 hypothetical protein E2C11_16640 [Streptomyces lavendulae]
MQALAKGFSRPDLSEPVWDRIAEVAWVLGHQEDIDADFLAIYGLDLEQVEISSRRYFALAHRLTAYQGVMTARVEEQRDQHGASSTPTRTRDAPPVQGGGETREVSLTAFRAIFPGIVSGGSAGGG